jgi:hypothetical protein
MTLPSESPSHSRAVLLCVLVGVALCACGAPRYQGNWSRLEEGMTREQVTALLGEPESVYKPLSDGGVSMVFSGTRERWHYGLNDWLFEGQLAAPRNAYVVWFRLGKVVESREPIAPPPIGPGTVVGLELPGTRGEGLSQRLHFCVFENGDNDLIYVGVRFGSWARGEFDLSIEGDAEFPDDKPLTRLFTGHIDYLLYEGVVLSMGDVLSEQPKPRLRITRVTGIFK